MDLPSVLPESVARRTVREDILSENKQKLSTMRKPLEPFDLDKAQINKLFMLIGEADLDNLHEIALYDSLPITRCMDNFLFLRPYQTHVRRMLALANEEFAARYKVSIENAMANYPESFRDRIVRRGIAFIDNFTLRQTASEQDTEDICVICLCNFEVNDNLRKLSCNHMYHRFCIDEWLVDTCICPICRTNFIGLEDIYSQCSFLYYSNTWSNSVRLYTIPLFASNTSATSQ